MVNGSDPSTLSATTTDRPAVPRFDMGTPKDEDKGGADDGDKSTKTKAKRVVAHNEQVLQAQSLYECAGRCSVAVGVEGRTSHTSVVQWFSFVPWS